MVKSKNFMLELSSVESSEVFSRVSSASGFIFSTYADLLVQMTSSNQERRAKVVQMTPQVTQIPAVHLSFNKLSKLGKKLYT